MKRRKFLTNLSLSIPGIGLVVSCSGNSKNVINRLLKGIELNCKQIGLSGNDGAELTKIADSI